MQEIELKFIIKNPDAMRRRFHKIGAKKVWAGKETAKFFDTRNRALSTQGAILRIKTTDYCTLTYKRMRSQKRYKIADELQIKLDGDQRKTLEQILRALGLMPTFSYSKKREFWDLRLKKRTVVLTLDSLLGKHYVEIEASPGLIQETAKRLGLDPKTGLTITYTSLLKRHNIYEKNY